MLVHTLKLQPWLSVTVKQILCVYAGAVRAERSSLILLTQVSSLHLSALKKKHLACDCGIAKFFSCDDQIPRKAIVGAVHQSDWES